MNVHLPPSDTFDLARECGVKWARIAFNWDVGEPTTGKHDWSAFHAVVDAAKARGLSVFATIGHGPAWASTGDGLGDGPGTTCPTRQHSGHS